MIDKLTKNFSALIISSLSIPFSLFISSLALSFIAYGRKESPEFQIWTLLSMAIGYLFTISLYGIWLSKNGRSFINEFNMNKRITVKGIGISIIVALIGILVTSLISISFHLLSPLFVNSVNESTDKIVNYNGPMRILMLLYPILFAPLFEEFLYRGLFGSVFRINDGNSKLSSFLFLSSNVIIFGFLHLQTTGKLYANVISVLFPMLTGLAFSILYLKTKNIFYPIIAHSAYNFIVIFISMS